MRKERTKRRPEGSMTLVEHLGELRHRLLVSVLATAAGGVLCFVFFEPIVRVLVAPYQEHTGRGLIFTQPLEAFLTRLKVGGYGGLTLASPVVLWQVWRFVTPGLYPKEKRYAVPFAISSLVLFTTGVVMAVTVLPRALGFLLNIGGPDLEPFITADSYISLVLLLMVAFGFAFQFPVLVTFLLLMRVLSTTQLRRWRGYAFLGIVVASAMITPQDPFSLFAMAVPIYLLYEVAILIGRLTRR